MAFDEDNCRECDRMCEPGETCCHGECVNTREDEAHCGGCFQPCGSQEHCCNTGSGGECVPLTGVFDISSGRTDYCGQCSWSSQTSCDPGEGCCDDGGEVPECVTLDDPAGFCGGDQIHGNRARI